MAGTFSIFCTALSKHMKLLFTTVLLISAPSLSLSGRELNGVVYFNESGPSASGTGELQLATQNGLVSLFYQKPFEQNFVKPSCHDIGAIWTVQTIMREIVGETLVAARCAGRVDPSVRPAWLAARDYLNGAAERAGLERGFRPGAKQQDGRVDLGGIVVDLFAYYQLKASGMCLQVTKCSENAAVVIQTSPDCYIRPELEFTVVKAKPNTWRMKSVRPSPY